jgi:hypothetical protein
MSFRRGHIYRCIGCRDATYPVSKERKCIVRLIDFMNQKWQADILQNWDRLTSDKSCFFVLEKDLRELSAEELLTWY